MDYIETWPAMEEAVEAGLVRSIGVSNFNKDQIERILQIAKIVPANNQVRKFTVGFAVYFSFGSGTKGASLNIFMNLKYNASNCNNSNIGALSMINVISCHSCHILCTMVLFRFFQYIDSLHMIRH